MKNLDSMIKNKYICMICGKEDFYGLLRRLYCGHCIDDTCLKRLFEIN